MIAERNAERASRVAEQFKALSGLLFDTSPGMGKAHEPGLVPAP